MKRAFLWTCIASAALLSACNDLLVNHDDPPTDALTSFDLLWQDFDRFYAFFEDKQIDWDAARTTYRARLTEHSSPNELFNVLTTMLAPMKDGHVSIHAPFVGNWVYDAWYKDRPANHDERVTLRQVSDLRNINGIMFYGWVEPDIGYIYIKQFGGRGWAERIDDILRALDKAAAIVIDVRSNGGGSDRNSDIIATRFADRKRDWAKVRYRDGPAHGDFTDWIVRTFEPGGKRQFTGPVALLTNRKSFSTSESFVLQMRVLPHVMVIGDTTGGGSGNPIMRELPNGWTYRIPRWQEVPLDGIPYEGIGLAPDITVWISEADARSERDTILERARQLLRLSLGAE